jgi:L-threonylcarbamoyladenylate synthase
LAASSVSTAEWAGWTRSSITSSSIARTSAGIVPGRIKVRRGKTPPSFKVQYPTSAGLKCLYTGTGTVQEVFLICKDADAAKAMADRTGDRRAMIDRTVEILRRGGVVAFPPKRCTAWVPTATNARAVERVFQIKGRPSTNPLICHVADAGIARRYAASGRLRRSRLPTRFWPGPVTIVLPKTEAIVSTVTAGLDTVGLRAPNHPLALELLRAFDGPLAGPSANKSNHVSPTTAGHVRDELGDDVDLVLDGGPCSVGIESTVLSLAGDVPRILRPGAITREMIESVIGMTVEETGTVAQTTKPQSSPGQFEKHYAPRTPAYRFEPRERHQIDLTDAAIIEPTLDPQAYARQFYARLRLLDAQQLRAIYIELPPDVSEWHAVRDRILRATRLLAEKPA